MASKELYGRTVLYYDADIVDSSNVKEILESSVDTFSGIQEEIEYLYDYYKGKQPVLERTKTYNTDILNKIVENRAAEIVNFKTGYLLSAPLQYIDIASNDNEEDIDNSDLVKMSKWCMEENKDASDLEVAQWQSICGTAYRMITQNTEPTDGEEEPSPFKIDTLDPRNTFVVYSSRLGHKPLMGVFFVDLGEDKLLYYVYTDTELFVMNEEFEDATDENNPSGAHGYNCVPIIEYPLNASRLGDFEQVIPLLDAINNCQSDRADSTEGFVQSILCLENIGIEPESPDQTQAQAETAFMTQLREIGGMFVPAGGKVYYVSPPELNQEATQVQKDDLYDAVLTICGMPNRNGGSSTSDTGAAVILRDGWSAAESRARATEIYFRKSERKFLNLMISICNNVGGTNIVISDVDIRFPRRNYTNDSANVTNLVTMLSNDWITPEFSYEHSSLTPDPHREYLRAKKWHDEQIEKKANELATINQNEEIVGQNDETVVPTEDIDA